MDENQFKHWGMVEKRGSMRKKMSDRIRLFVLGPDDEPVAERFCSGVDQSPVGLAIRTPGTLEPGVRVVVVKPGQAGPDIWLARVAHVRICSSGERVLGLERLEMSDRVSKASWMHTIRSAA